MAFEFRHQPFKALYILATVLVLLGIRVPVWCVTFLNPAWRPRRSWTFRRSLTVQLVRHLGYLFMRVGLPYVPTAADARATPGFVVIEAAPEFVTGEIQELVELSGAQAMATSGYWYVKTGPSDVAHKARPGEKVLCHIHDGGNIMGSAHPMRANAVITALLTRLPYITRAFACEYRLASTAPYPTTNGFPSAMLDIIAAYKYLVLDRGFEPQNILLSGDSNGGTQAMSLARHLAQSAFPALGVPRALLMISPTTDWGYTHAGPAAALARNRRSDYVDSLFAHTYPARAFAGRLPASAPAASAWLSPGSLALGATAGLFRGLPPAFVAAGGAEQTLDGMRTLAARLEADLGTANVTYREYPDSSHNPIKSVIYGIYDPQRENLLRDIEEWARTHLQ